jgi:hypothetical protein
MTGRVRITLNANRSSRLDQLTVNEIQHVVQREYGDHARLADEGAAQTASVSELLLMITPARHGQDDREIASLVFDGVSPAAGLVLTDIITVT